MQYATYNSLRECSKTVSAPTTIKNRRMQNTIHVLNVRFYMYILCLRSSCMMYCMSQCMFHLIASETKQCGQRHYAMYENSRKLNSRKTKYTEQN